MKNYLFFCFFITLIGCKKEIEIKDNNRINYDSDSSLILLNKGVNFEPFETDSAIFYYLKAIKVFEEQFKEKEKTKDIKLRLGYLACLYSAGNKKTAIKEFENLKKEFPDNKLLINYSNLNANLIKDIWKEINKNNVNTTKPQ